MHVLWSFRLHKCTFILWGEKQLEIMLNEESNKLNKAPNNVEKSSFIHLLLHDDDVDGAGHVGRVDVAVPLLEGAIDPVEVRNKV